MSYYFLVSEGDILQNNLANLHEDEEKVKKDLDNFTELAKNLNDIIVTYGDGEIDNQKAISEITEALAIYLYELTAAYVEQVEKRFGMV